MLLDTAFLIDLMSGDEDALAAAKRLEESGVPQRIPAMVVYELHVGVGKTEMTDTEAEKIQAVTESRSIESLPAETAKLAGRIDGVLRREGNRVGSHDVIIGTTARRYDKQVLTGNPSDFEDIPEVSVRTYRDESRPPR